MLQQTASGCMNFFKRSEEWKLGWLASRKITISVSFVRDSR